MSKPNTEKCSECFVKNNALRCMTCKYKTLEWINNYALRHPIMLLGEHDNFKPSKTDS